MRYSFSYLHDQSVSEDIVQEIFIHLWENSENIKINSSLKAYMFRMARNKSLNYLRNLKITDNEKILQALAETEFTASENDTDKVNQQKVKKIMDSFPNAMKRVVELKYYGDYSHSEIASELNITVETVKTHLKRAKKKALPFLFILLYFL